MKFTAVVTPEGDSYVAQCAEEDVASQGRTVEAAVAALQEALELRFGVVDVLVVRFRPA